MRKPETHAGQVVLGSGGEELSCGWCPKGPPPRGQGLFRSLAPSPVHALLPSVDAREGAGECRGEARGSWGFSGENERLISSPLPKEGDDLCPLSAVPRCGRPPFAPVPRSVLTQSRPRGSLRPLFLPVSRPRALFQRICGPELWPHASPQRLLGCEIVFVLCPAGSRRPPMLPGPPARSGLQRQPPRTCPVGARSRGPVRTSLEAGKLCDI